VPPARLEPEIREAPSPNQGPRRGVSAPELILIHYTGMASAEAAIARLRDPASEVSSHYLIAEDGQIWRLVDETRRAWHAGAGRWGSETDINSRSIGIELANPGPLAAYPPFPEAQMAALEALIDRVRARWRVPVDRILGHSDTAPGRKIDPGPKFDWRRLALGGRAIWPDAAREARPIWADFECAAARAGYGSEAGREAVLDALRLRFRPWARGRALEAEDVAIARALP
jgi:N-acetylmuramoyl-L-alanine amidase